MAQRGTYVATGTFIRLNRTTFAYGKYGVRDHRGVITCAVRNGPNYMQRWVGKFVYVKGCMIEGYPIAGGPPYLDLTYLGDDPASRDAVPECQ